MSDYEVGYGRPPKEFQFRPGKSGNPKGKPSGARSFRSELLRELNGTVLMPENGKMRRISKKRIIARAFLSKTAKGDIRAADRLAIHLIQAEAAEQQRQDRSSSKLSDADLQIIAHLLGDVASDTVASPDSLPPDTDEQSSVDTTEG